MNGIESKGRSPFYPDQPVPVELFRGMKQLNVIRSGDAKGEYVFNVRMVRLYIWLDSFRKSRK